MLYPNHFFGHMQVLSLGDQRSYYLGTAKNELGVVYARHPASGETRAGAIAGSLRVVAAHLPSTDIPVVLVSWEDLGVGLLSPW